MKKKRRSERKPAARRGSSSRFTKTTAGKWTLQEILSQPESWRETERTLARDPVLAEISAAHLSNEPWLFVACGSSYYLSRTIATQWSQILQVACTAVPASELLFAPEQLLKRTGARRAVLVSRSGKTTEVLRAAKWLAAHGGIQTLGITCNANSELSQSCTRTLKLPWADERSMVMTRSFTAILLVLQRLGARLAGNPTLASALDSLPEKTERWLAANADKIRAFAAKRRFADYVFLGQGAHYWLAQEAALKMTEMSSSYAQAYHTLEFRHGPKSIASRQTLITFLLSEAAAEEELPLIGEVKKLGATTMVVANRATAQLKHNADLLIELGLDEPEYARMALTTIPAHLLGFEVGLRKGLNPDVPKNLTRAVVLDSKDSPPANRRTP